MQHRILVLVFAAAIAVGAGTSSGRVRADEPPPKPKPRLNLRLLPGLRVLTTTKTPLAVATPTAPPVDQITGSIPNLDLINAVVLLGKLSGLTVSVPPRPDSPPPVGNGAVRLDYDRRATLNWDKKPLSDALREFCRAYGCGLMRDYRGGLTVTPGPLPSGPVARVPGFQIEVSRIQFSDSRTSGEEAADNPPRRVLQISLLVRTTGGDMGTILTIENVRILDQAGRDVLDLGSGGSIGPTGRTVQTAFPDERQQTFTFDWPYPNPSQLKVIEGDLLVCRSVRRTSLEIPLTAETNRSTVNFGDAQLQFSTLQVRDDSINASLQVVQPPTLDLQTGNGQTPVSAVFSDGTRRPLLASINYWNVQDGWMSGYASIQGSGLPSAPVKLIWDALLKSEATRRHHFRFSAFPGQIYPEQPAPPRSASRPRPAKPAPRK